MTAAAQLRGATAAVALPLVIALGCRERPELAASASPPTTPVAGAPTPAAAPIVMTEVMAATPNTGLLDDAATNAPASRPRPPAATAPSFSPKSAVYDPTGPAYSLLQSPAQGMATFPGDMLGSVDWAQSLRDGLIDPRAELHGRGSMQIRSDDIIMTSTREMPWVRFPHRMHTEWLACSNCHPKPFRTQTGQNGITMDSIMRGEHCGQCHDRVAFSIFACERCHSVVHDDSPRAWW